MQRKYTNNNSKKVVVVVTVMVVPVLLYSFCQGHSNSKLEVEKPYKNYLTTH